MSLGKDRPDLDDTKVPARGDGSQPTLYARIYGIVYELGQLEYNDDAAVASLRREARAVLHEIMVAARGGVRIIPEGYPTREEATLVDRRATAQPSVVGAWFVDAEGAPYRPHQFAFTRDGLVLTTNPTNVQDAGDAPTTDSVGMGMWRREDGDTYVGTFYQENANQPGKTPAPRLRVTFRITVASDGATFEGPAFAELEGVGGGPATLRGVRLGVDVGALNDLP